MRIMQCCEDQCGRTVLFQAVSDPEVNKWWIIVLSTGLTRGREVNKGTI